MVKLQDLNQKVGSKKCPEQEAVKICPPLDCGKFKIPVLNEASVQSQDGQNGLLSASEQLTKLYSIGNILALSRTKREVSTKTIHSQKAGKQKMEKSNLAFSIFLDSQLMSRKVGRLPRR